MTGSECLPPRAVRGGERQSLGRVPETVNTGV